MNVIERIERGEIKVISESMIKTISGNKEVCTGIKVSNDEPEATAELLRLVKIGAAMQWVPCSERLPEPGKVCDIWDCELGRNFEYMYSEDDNAFIKNAFPAPWFIPAKDVTHWRYSGSDKPLPPLPEVPE